MKFIFLLLVILLVQVPLSHAYLSIPPTKAFSMINGTTGNVTANSYADFVELVAGSGITIGYDYTLHEITFSATGGAISSIHQIANVTATGCGIGQILSPNSSAIWACSSAGAGNATILNDLGDVVTTPTFGEVLYYDGNKWEDHILILQQDIGDVVVTLAEAGDFLFYDGADWIDKTFGANTITCTAGQFFSAFDNQTGDYTCSTPSGGSGFNNIASVSTSANATIISDNSTVANRAVFKTISAGQGIDVDNGTQSVIIKTDFKTNTTTCSGTDKMSAYDNATGDFTCSTDQSGGATAREVLAGHFEMDRTYANIGTAYVDAYTTAEGVRIDTTGMSTVTFQVQWTKVGAGTQSCQIVDVTNGANVLIVFSNLASGLNTNATVSIPAGLANTIKTYEPQCKSTTSTDDPVWLSSSVLLAP